MMINRLFTTFALVALSNSVAAVDWSYKGLGYSLGTTGVSSDFGTDTGRMGRIVELKAYGLPTRETTMPVCYELEFFNESQEGLLYCKKAKGSALSESVFTRTPIKGDNKTFVCIKKCRTKTPKVLRLKYDNTD
ncbi:hypothetical protein [Undibacterium danionis]|uniref:Uncharacterized protein n=1 Tax=Undibacterium danionis TaxID=1812100 RepID=A0ABV6IFB5_9BURK